MKKNSALVLIVLMMFVGCSSDKTMMTPVFSQEPLVKLKFTEPPIDLQDVEAQFAENVPYDDFNRTKFDIFLPPSSEPTGLVIFIHGGGFIRGDKSFIYTKSGAKNIVELLKHNIAVATLNYRLISAGDEDGVLKSLRSSKRALQYIRYIHKELNIDKDKIALYGSSAGASTSLWLATNDDLRDMDSPDPVLHESTRVKGVVLTETQASLDLQKRWVEDVFVDFGTSIDDLFLKYGTTTLFGLYGVSDYAEYASPKTNEYRQKVDMLSLLSADDPEIWARNIKVPNGQPVNTSTYSHHPFHVREIQEYAERAGVPVVAIYGNPVLFDNSNEEDYVDFFIRKLSE